MSSSLPNIEMTTLFFALSGLIQSILKLIFTLDFEMSVIQFHLEKIEVTPEPEQESKPVEDIPNTDASPESKEETPQKKDEGTYSIL